MKSLIKKTVFLFIVISIASLIFTGCSQNGTYVVSKITKTDNMETIVLNIKEYDYMTASQKLLADIYKDKTINVKGHNIKILSGKNDTNVKTYGFEIKNNDMLFDDPLMNNSETKYTFSNGKIYLTFAQLNSVYEIEFKKA